MFFLYREGVSIVNLAYRFTMSSGYIATLSCGPGVNSISRLSHSSYMALTIPLSLNVMKYWLSCDGFINSSILPPELSIQVSISLQNTRDHGSISSIQARRTSFSVIVRSSIFKSTPCPGFHNVSQSGTAPFTGTASG